MKENKIINLGNGKVVTLSFTAFDTDSDLDDITSIHYENLAGEMVTISTLLNKVGILKADIENLKAEATMDLSVFEAELRRKYKASATASGTKLTVQGLEDKVLEDSGWKAKKKDLIRIERDCAYIDSLYWSIQSKDKKLSVLIKGITPTEFESGIADGVINQIVIKKHKSVM